MSTVGEKPVHDSAPSRSSEEKSHRPLASSVLLAKKGKTWPLAKMMPRVQCLRCEFTGKQGKEMRDHIKKEHEIDLKCKECDFKTKFKIVKRRHMLNTHKKPCKRCDHVAKSDTQWLKRLKTQKKFTGSKIGAIFGKLPHEAPQKNLKSGNEPLVPEPRVRKRRLSLLIWPFPFLWWLVR